MFIGYNFFSDADSLTPNYNDIGNIKKIRLEKAIFDDLFIANELQTYNKNRETWGMSTVILAKFQGNTEGGNVNFGGQTVAKLRIKRRKINESKWITIKEIDYTEEKFTTYDIFNATNQEYEYALVPVMANGTEGNYNTEGILSKFDACYILDSENSYKLLYDLEYGQLTSNMAIGKYQPIGSKYPIHIKNGDMDYDSGSVTATLISESTENAYGEIDSMAEINLRKSIMKFLKNGKAKVLKDFNGNMEIIGVSQSPTFEFFNELNGRVGKVGFNWDSIGDIESEKDLRDLGLLK